MTGFGQVGKGKGIWTWPLRKRPRSNILCFRERCDGTRSVYPWKEYVFVFYCWVAHCQNSAVENSIPFCLTLSVRQKSRHGSAGFFPKDLKSLNQGVSHSACSFRGLTKESSASKLSKVVGKIHFLEAVVFVTVCVLRARNRGRISATYSLWLPDPFYLFT